MEQPEERIDVPFDDPWANEPTPLPDWVQEEMDRAVEGEDWWME